MGITDQLQGKAWGKPLRRLLPVSGISNVMAFGLATLGGIITAIFAVMIPISTLESLTGATGLSEIIPAAGAPLGSSARTLFVIFSAILMASIILVLMLSFRKKPDEQAKAEEAQSHDSLMHEKAKNRKRMPIMNEDSELAEKIHLEDEQRRQEFSQKTNANDGFINDELAVDDMAKANISESGKGKITTSAKGMFAAVSGGVIAASASMKSKIKKLPFMGGDDRVRSFDDLPKLRSEDKHPDAPARRPLSAHEDLGAKILDPDTPLSQTAETEVQDSVAPAVENEVEAEAVSEPSYNEEAHLQPQTLVQESIQKLEEPIESVIHHDPIVDESPDKAPTESPTVQKSLIKAPDELPALDDLMARFENLVSRRSADAQDISEPDEQKSETVETQKADNFSDTPIEPVTQNVAADVNIASDDGQETAIEQDIVAPVSDEPISDQKIPAFVQNEAPEIPERSFNPEQSLTKEKSHLSEVKKNDDVVVSKTQKAEMDSALQSALDTLHKMTERSA